MGGGSQRGAHLYGSRAYFASATQLNLYNGACLPDMAHNQELLIFAEYAYATTNT